MVTGCWAWLASPAVTVLLAQDTLPPWEGGSIVSLGQPSRTRLYGGVRLGVDWRRAYKVEPSSHATFSLTHYIGNPVPGRLAATAELYGGLRGTEGDGGARALLEVPALGVALGSDFNLRDHRFGFVVGLTIPIRRGGVLRGGTLLRGDWESGPLSAAHLAVNVPIRQPTAGRTRPLKASVDVGTRKIRPTPLPQGVPGLDSTLGQIRAAALRLTTLVMPYLDHRGADPRAALRPLLRELRDSLPFAIPPGAGLNVDGVVRAYHAEIVRAFSIAASGVAVPEGGSTPEGVLAATRARESLRERVLYPYDGLLGQWKSKRTLDGLIAFARGNFASGIVAHTALPPERETALLYVFEQLLATVTAVERRQREAWGDSRLIWLPLQLALLPEDHDTQEELDAIIQGVEGAEFSDGNRIWYVVNQQFPAEVIRTLEQAEDYHVLWIHDFRGVNDAGLPDVFSLGTIVDAYLRVLAARVRDYDRSGRLPVYMIFIDQHYYEANRARMWLDLLERPLGRLPDLHGASTGLGERMAAGQQALKDAVAGSRLLQAEARQYGAEWLRNVVKVQINVTNPVDPSFWSHQILPLLGIPDNIMRDHRKIVFYDITEEDPYRGLAIYTGMGIGEHYTSPTWEDRAMLVQGPAVLSLKTQARRLLEGQGIDPARIPYPLRSRPLATGYRQLVEQEIARRREQGERDQRAIELHNGTGFQQKEVTVARAVLYSLMPPGSVIKTPDSLWGNALFASLLAGSAFRGCRVLFVAPSLAAAPSPDPLSMALTHDLFARLIVLQQEFGPEIEAVQGMLKTGIYNPGVGVNEVGARIEAAYTNARRTPFLRRLFPLDPSVDTLLVHARALLPLAGDSAAARRSRVSPKLHLKANFFASREAWDHLMARPELAQVFAAYLIQLANVDPRASDVKVASGALLDASEQLEAAFLGSLTPGERERVIYYLLIGSANEDYRSMLMDGEASVLLSGWSGVVGVIDFTLIMNLSIWIDDLEMLDVLIPSPTPFNRALARQVRPAL